MPVEVGAVDDGAVSGAATQLETILAEQRSATLVAEVTQPTLDVETVVTAPAASAPVQPSATATPQLTLPPPEPVAQPVTAESPQPAPAPLRPDDQMHLDRLRQGLGGRAERPRCQPRDPAWQQERRQCEQRIRAEVASLANDWRAQGVSAGAIAELLDCPTRTLRQWQHDWLNDRLQARPLGRPHVRCGAEQSRQVIHFLHYHGPQIGMPTLSGQFPDAPLAELRDVLGVFRHLWAAHASALSARELYWHRPGTVWAMDFTKAHHAIDGTHGYLLAVRDLASGLQLAWRPLRSPDAAAVVAELRMLFTIHGAPVVLKSDNGSPFFAALTKALFATWQVWPLYSPPGMPCYNGSISRPASDL